MESRQHYKRNSIIGTACQASTSSVRRNIHDAKVLLSIKWVHRRNIYCKMLKMNETIIGGRYQTQLMQSSRVLCEKRTQWEQRNWKWFACMTRLGFILPNQLRPCFETLKCEVLPLAIFPRYCTARLVLVSFHGKWSGCSAVPLVRKHLRMTWFVDGPKRWTLLLWWFSSFARKIGKSCRQREEYSKWFICDHAFSILWEFHQKILRT